MSIAMMESFQRFDLGSWDFSTKRPIQVDNEWREFGGYNAVADTTNGQWNQNIGYDSLGIYQDPVITSKRRIGMGVVPPGSTQQLNSIWGLERVFSAPKTKYVVGFLIRFRLGPYVSANGGSYDFTRFFEFCAAGRSRLSPSTTAALRMQLVGGATQAAQSVFGADSGNIATTGWWVSGATSSRASVPPTFRMKGVTDPNASGIQLKYDTDHFFECEVDTVAKTLKVWVDDAYAGQATWNDTYDAALANGFQIRLGRQAGATITASADMGGIFLSDIYCVDISDSITPNTRLGKTTRVMGEAPDADVSTMFARPDSFNGNYDVINDPIADTTTPVNYLTGDGAGAEDMYQTTNSNISQFAGQVYGVQIHARFQNASAASHTMAVTTQDATTKTENSLGSIGAGSGIQMRSVILNKTPSGDNWTAAKAASLKYGFKIVN